MQNLVANCHTMRVYDDGGPNKFWVCYSLTPWDRGHIWSSRNMPLLHMCYHSEFGHPTLNHIGIGREVQQNWNAGILASWGGTCLMPRNVVGLPSLIFGGITRMCTRLAQMLLKKTGKAIEQWWQQS